MTSTATQMFTGQTFWMPSTGALFNVLETDGVRGIAAGFRTGGRVLVTAHDGGFYLRQVTDNGGLGTLLATLDPCGPRYTVKSSTCR